MMASWVLSGGVLVLTVIEARRLFSTTIAAGVGRFIGAGLRRPDLDLAG